jgi:hypothetical protein
LKFLRQSVEQIQVIGHRKIGLKKNSAAEISAAEALLDGHCGKRVELLSGQMPGQIFVISMAADHGAVVAAEA